ncbi:DASH complex subunit Dad4, partial [Fennellomyces sp. T-0311]
MDPYEKAQNALLIRIIDNVSKLSEAVDNLNERVEEANKENRDLSLFKQMFSSYYNSSQMYLQTTKSHSDSTRTP